MLFSASCTKPSTSFCAPFRVPCKGRERRAGGRRRLGAVSEAVGDEHRGQLPRRPRRPVVAALPLARRRDRDAAHERRALTLSGKIVPATTVPPPTAVYRSKLFDERCDCAQAVAGSARARRPVAQARRHVPDARAAIHGDDLQATRPPAGHADEQMTAARVLQKIRGRLGDRDRDAAAGRFVEPEVRCDARRRGVAPPRRRSAP